MASRIKSGRYSAAALEMLSIVADNIKDARHRAKKAYGVGPAAVSRAPAQGDLCNGCDGSPCVCGGG